MNFEKIKNEVKYLLFDLDGTLINTEKTLAKENYKIPNLLNKLNLKFTIITGRPHYMMKKEIDLLRPTLPIVGNNGCTLIDQNTYQVLKTHQLNQNIVNELLKYFVQNNICFYMYTPTQIYIYPDHFEHVDNWKKAIQKLEIHYQWKISNLNDYKFDEPIIKFMLCSDKYQMIDDHIKLYYRDKLSLTKSTIDSIEICNILFDKGTGLKDIMKMLNATPEQFMVFGDGGNDIPMFEIAKYSVALKNALDFVKSKATFITDYTNDENGVYRFIEKIWLT